MSEAEPGLTERALIRVMVVEDHQMVAGALRMAIAAEADMDVVAMASTMAEALELAKRVTPDVVVVDYRLPDGDASELVPALFGIMSDPRVLVISGWTDDRSVARAVEAGASGFIPKQQPVEELVDAVRRVAGGEAVFAPALLARLIGRLRPGSAPRAAVDLTERETEVLAALARGASTSAIANELYVSVNTVRNHIASILAKLGAHSRLEAVAKAIREGIISTPDSH
ncbi:MAG: two component transcriptional regulator, LuxR family [Acidimicrobiia bacterium]|nr:two component transcriptional regulator, LuxR family [Acidimicrobiia bacterium]